VPGVTILTGMKSPARHNLPARDRVELLARGARALEGLTDVRAAWVFGSFARGEPFRDLDLAVWLDHPISWRSGPGVQNALDAALCVPFPIDVVVLNDASAAFRHAVTQQGRVVHEREPGTANALAAQAASGFFDLEAWRRVNGPSR